MTIPQTCLVTGGAGFIGSHLCEELLNRKYKVICVDNLLTGSKNNISHLLENPNFQFIEHDIIYPLPPTTYNLQHTTHIYHLASPASPPKYQKYSRETLLTNSLGTYNTLKLALSLNARFLLASTSEVYGDPKIHPQSEEYWGNVNPVGLRSCYDESKRFAEALTMDFIKKDHLNARIIRIFNTYGPKMDKDDGRVVTNFINQALKEKPLTVYGDGSQTRALCFIKDMVAGIILAQEKESTAEEIINLGNPDEKNILEIARIILALTKSKSEIQFTSLPGDDPARRKPDITKAQKLLGWRPQISLNEGLVLTIKYYSSL